MLEVEGSFEEEKADESNGFVFHKPDPFSQLPFPPALWIKSSSQTLCLKSIYKSQTLFGVGLAEWASLRFLMYETKRIRELLPASKILIFKK